MWIRRKKDASPPALPQARPEAPASFLRRLQWTVLRPLATNLGGDERSLARGHGIELVELREYQPGDDIRHIDWNVTARSDRTFVRESLVERGLDVWLLVDVSGSIDWGTALCSKRDRTAEFAAAAGQMLGRHGNRVGVVTFAERPQSIVPPAAGRAQLLRLLASIHQAPRQSARGRTDLAGAIAYANGIVRRRSLILVVSDFLVPDGWQATLNTLAQRHEVVAVRLHDPREAELPDVGIVTLEDPKRAASLSSIPAMPRCANDSRMRRGDRPSASTPILPNPASINSCFEPMKSLFRPSCAFSMRAVYAVPCAPTGQATPTG